MSKYDTLKKIVKWADEQITPYAKRTPELFKYITPALLSLAALLGPFAVLGTLLVAGALAVRVIRSTQLQNELILRKDGKIIRRVSRDEIDVLGRSETKVDPNSPKGGAGAER